jgi:hypothetical protein
VFAPDEEIVQLGSHVKEVVFLMKGHLAICEPDGNAICILVEGCTFGEFNILNQVPCLYSIHADDSFNIKSEFMSGKKYAI